MIDEFQDFSEPFFELTEAIRLVNSGVSFFCVGDDWQAIYGFAGADLYYFKDFDRLFRDTATPYVSTNYRSERAIVDAGNALMTGWASLQLQARGGRGWWRCTG